MECADVAEESADAKPAARSDGAASAGAAPSLPTGWPLLVFAGFALLDGWVYRGALHGQFVSDDIGYIVTSPYTSQLSASALAAIFDPFGAASLYTANYAPVHLLLTAIERSIFAGEVLGYHLVNVAIHALNSTLLVALLLRSRVPAAGALLGGLLFAVHPANVEAVAWVSQLKTNASLAFSLGALLALFRRPGLAAALFALGLLTKASALFALPTAIAFAWARPEEARRGRSARWLVVWALLFIVYAVPQLAFFSAVGAVEVPAYENPWVHLRTIASVGARYLVMAATGYGVSAFHEPEPTFSPLDPWWLAALPLGALLAWRTHSTLRSRSDEGAWWLSAMAAFAPVSQIFPFLNPVADRYLYFVLPGLIGGSLLAFQDWRSRHPAMARLDLVAVGAGLALALFFATGSVARARLWSNSTLLYLDAARHYPEGGTAAFLAARRAAQQGDAALAVGHLRRAADHGIDRFTALRNDPGLAPIRDSPEFEQLMFDMAGRWIERASRREHPTAADLRGIAQAHVVRKEYDRARAALERALGMGGPFEEVVRAELEALRERTPEAGRGAAARGDEHLE
jgi:tetratricopeptide (TPR) repeat protein